MQLRYDTQLASMLKSMTDVVLPAIDPGNTLATEQAKLVIGMLGLMLNQLPVQYRCDRDELIRLIHASSALEKICTTDQTLIEMAGVLLERRRQAEDLLPGCAVDPSDLIRMIRSLRSAISLTVSESARAVEEVEDSVRTVVLSLSREQALRERALLASQGWESGLPTVEELLKGG